MTVVKHYSAPKPPITKEPSWFLVILLSGILSGLLLFTIGWYLSLSDIDRHAVMKKILSASDIFPGIGALNRPKLLLVMGVDMPPKGSKNDYEAVRTDTMMLLHMDPSNKQANVVSIPRDSKVFIAGNRGINKINAAFAVGGPDVAVSTVEQTFGVSVDHYMVINLRAVREVVDALGGIDVYVEKPMHYQDLSAGLYIDFHPGPHHLDGKQAEGFLRFRHDALGDIGRIRRQQAFISAVTAKLKDPTVLLKISPILSATQKMILTDMSSPQLISTALFLRELNRSNLQMATIPGHPSLYSQVSYWVIDPKPTEEMLNRMVTGVRSDNAETSTTTRPSVGILYTSAYSVASIEDYKARLATMGFDVSCKREVRQSGTKLITHNNRLSKDVESALQQSNHALKDAQLIFYPHGTTFESNSCGNTDYTIILGDDTRRALN
jgi:polyisoprenyl-teichoic acid--peptidoglycan teichoic acid transferase